MAAASLRMSYYNVHGTGRHPHGLHFHLSSQHSRCRLLCRRGGTLGWVLMPQCPPPHLNSQRSHNKGQRLGNKTVVTAMVADKESGRRSTGKQSRELKFNAEDLLELKFGQLLGESRETTLAKVIGRKINPGASYVEIEKPRKKTKEAQAHEEAGVPGLLETDKFARLLDKKEERSGAPPQRSSAVNIAKGIKAVKATTTSDLPSLAPPPSRSTAGTSTTQAQGTAAKSGLGESAPPPLHTKRAVPVVTFGPGGYAASQGKKKAESEEDDNDNNYMGLQVRKPKLSSQDLYKPSWPTTKVILPMKLHKIGEALADSSGGGKDDDALLRRPTAAAAVDCSNDIGSVRNVNPKLMASVVAPRKPPSEVVKPAAGVGRMTMSPVIEDNDDDDGRVQGSSAMSEERFTRLLELASSPPDARRDQEQMSADAAKASTSKKKKLLILGSKPLPLSPGRAEREQPKEAAAADQNGRVDDRPGSDPLLTTTTELAASMTQVESLSPSIDVGVLGVSKSRSLDAVSKLTTPSEADADADADDDDDDDDVSPSPSSFSSVDVKPELASTLGSLKRSILQLRTKEANPIAPPLPPPSLPSPVVLESQLAGEEETLPDEMMVILDEVDEKRNLSTSASAVLKTAINIGRLAGWSDEVKAAVRRSEVALVKEEKWAPSSSELNLKRLLQEDKPDPRIDNLRKQPPVALARPIAPQPIARPALTGATVDPLDLTRQQLAQTRPMPSSPKPYAKTTSNEDSSPNKELQEAGFVLSDQTRVPSKEEEDQDWLKAEALLESNAIEEMLFFGANAGGMLVSYGSLVGFLPSWELSAQRRPPSFKAWAKEKGFTVKEPESTETVPGVHSSLSGVSETGSKADVGSETANRTRGTSSIRVEEDEERRNLLRQYREERGNLLSNLVGETAHVVVTGLDRRRRRLRLSERAAEGEGQELTQKKANVMAGLNVGDVVSCTVKKVTTYGAFVEVQGVPALIHISELSWNRIVDPTTVVAVGQELQAKVCRLDRFMQRINLSLKQMQVDPLQETLESLLSTDMDLDSVDVAVAIDANKVQDIPEVNGVIKRLEQIKGIDRVVKGRCVQGAAMAPSFQVYLSGQLGNGYKLIARSGNQVQEVLVWTSLDRESTKQTILQCTMRDD